MDAFDLPGSLRRIRRIADLSQRQLAEAAQLGASTIGRAESGSGDLAVGVVSRLAGLAGLRLGLLDEAGREVAPMTAKAIRDKAGRRFPAHLDTRYGDEDWWHGWERYAREQPWYTFDRLRHTRDHWRSRSGTPDDHQLPQPGDSPAERSAARRRAARLRREEEAGPRRPIADLECRCPSACDDLDDWSGRPVHAEDCPCSCDVS